jgi:hypothetical protein
MGFTVRELMNFIDKAIENHINEVEAKGENYNLNQFLDAEIVLGNDEELNGARLCLGFKFLNENDKKDFNELDLGVELEEDKNYVLLS